MSYMIISFSHKNTDIDMREKLAFSSDDTKDLFLRNILDNSSTKEAILLSTCNRVEIITKTSNIKVSSRDILEKLAKYSNIEYETLSKRADVYDNDGAVHHLFSVAAALDSVVIGETQIVGQLKDAFRFSQVKGYSQQGLTRIIHYAFKCAANVRTATSLGSGSVSVSSTAVAKAKELVGDTKGLKALVIGAGQMSELAIKHLNTAGFSVVLTSRDIKKAQQLASSFDFSIEVEPYSNLRRLLNLLPIMITATSAPYPIITKDLIDDVGFNRYWFDIAVPRDIEDIDLNGLHIYAVDDLQDIVNQNMTQRAAQAKMAYSIVSKMSLEFYDWLKSLEIEPIVKKLYVKADNVVDKKLKNAIKKGFIKAEDEENIRKLCQTVLTEYLHTPSKRLKTISQNMECDVVIGTIQNMFELNDSVDLSTKYKCEHIE